MANNLRFIDKSQYSKHFTYNQRIELQKLVTENRNKMNLKTMAEIMEKDPTTLSKEVKKNRSLNSRPSYSHTSWANSICVHLGEC